MLTTKKQYTVARRYVDIILKQQKLQQRLQATRTGATIDCHNKPSSIIMPGKPKRQTNGKPNRRPKGKKQPIAPIRVCEEM